MTMFIFLDKLSSSTTTVLHCDRHTD